jgi:hypothetical protein
MEFPMKYLLDLTSSLLTKGRRFLPSQLSRNLGGFLLLIPNFGVHSAGDAGVSRSWVYCTNLMF